MLSREEVYPAPAVKNFVRRAPSGKATSKERRRPEEAAIRPARFVWIEAKHKRADREVERGGKLCKRHSGLPVAPS